MPCSNDGVIKQAGFFTLITNSVPRKPCSVISRNCFSRLTKKSTTEIGCFRLARLNDLVTTSPTVIMVLEDSFVCTSQEEKLTINVSNGFWSIKRTSSVSFLPCDNHSG